MNHIRSYFKYGWPNIVWRVLATVLGILGAMFILWIFVSVAFLVDPGNPYNY